MDVARFFGEEARARVAEAVRRAEALSRGQIVPVVVDKSDAYPEVRTRGALVGAGLATIAVLALGLPLTLAELPALQLAAGLLGALASAWNPIERRLAGARAMDEAVRARAVHAFQEHGLHRTAEGTGVLLFASLFERQAVVLGDRGIDAKMGKEWPRTVAALVEGMRRRDPAGGFVEAIAIAGARLAEHFPRDPAAPVPPENELEDAIRTSRA
jgi:putative membrane protein